MNEELILNIINMLSEVYADAEIEHKREINPPQECFYVLFRTKLQQILKITDDCIEDNLPKNIMYTICHECLGLMKEKPCNVIRLKRDLSIELIEL